jgi:hypothetical protein
MIPRFNFVRAFITASAASLFALVATGGCGSDDGSTFSNGGGSNSGNGGGANSSGSGGLNLGGGSGDGPKPCVNLECKKEACTGSPKTSLSGTIYDPSGTLPLYNVAIYVPNKPVDPIVNGASCDKCGELSGSPVVSALTDTAGNFKLDDIPVSDNLPVVIQVGKWRKQITIPTVTSCADNPIAADQTRLPADQGEGEMPQIALTTGEADALECLLKKLGIHDQEFTPAGGPGRVHLFGGVGGTNQFNSSMNGGAAFADSQTLWANLDSLKIYDVIILSCEGNTYENTKPAAARQALKDYLDMGGRVFASHWHNIWLEEGPDPFPTIADFDHQSDIGDFTADIDMTFPKGQALADWLINVNGSTTLGQIDISDAQHTVNSENAALAQRWIYSTSPTSVQYLSGNTPLGAPDEQLCGRVVFSDIHVSSGDTSSTSDPYPDGCTSSGLTPQEKVLAFMLFDLSSCIIPDDEVPVPPPVK